MDLSSPKVMGILNITPDSFFDGGRNFSSSSFLKQTEKMLKEGADFIDIGGYSSRSGAENISVDEEIDRIEKAIDLILKNFPDTLISIDTFRHEVAQIAVQSGAAIINDISGGTLDSEMWKTAAKLNCPYVLMHMRGNPKTMTSLTQYQNVTVEVLKDLSEKIRMARSFGINDIIVDPGFGFAKTKEQSFELLNNLDLFLNLDFPVLVGVSRKSFIYKTLNASPEEALNGTIILNAIALLKGSSILRVHDVAEAVECIKIAQNLEPIQTYNYF